MKVVKEDLPVTGGSKSYPLQRKPPG